MLLSVAAGIASLLASVYLKAERLPLYLTAESCSYEAYTLQQVRS